MKRAPKQRLRLNPVLLEIIPTEQQLTMLDFTEATIDPLLAKLTPEACEALLTLAEIAYRFGIAEGQATVDPQDDDTHPTFAELIDVEEVR
jgi:hypothetical protein